MIEVVHGIGDVVGLIGEPIDARVDVTVVRRRVHQELPVEILGHELPLMPDDLARVVPRDHVRADRRRDDRHQRTRFHQATHLAGRDGATAHHETRPAVQVQVDRVKLAYATGCGAGAAAATAVASATIALQCVQPEAVAEVAEVLGLPTLVAVPLEQRLQRARNGAEWNEVEERPRQTGAGHVAAEVQHVLVE